ncbi:DJ-1/PfpI family protein [Rhizobium phaseoli]|uniref:DJ-1/PfpI family protein n=1 Tax=Rhizobium phaseoli TaxID=396 RepID=UPI000A7B94D7|nr:DJ-1/PfpI family protein [Rhizobium phaseoli]
MATPNFTLMPLACFTDFLRLAGDEGDFSRRIYCDWELLSHNLDPIRSSCGLELTPGRTYGDPGDYDFIVVHGGILHADHRIPPELYAFVTDAVRQGVPVAGNCSGSFVLAEAGLLAGKRSRFISRWRDCCARPFPTSRPSPTGLSWLTEIS